MRQIVFQKITLENFKSYSDMEFNFTPNKFAVITGNNGTGKSTIFDALCWCLYDKTITGRSGDSVLNIRNPRNCYVKLELTIDGVPCIVENYRNHSVHENGKYVTYNGNTDTYTSSLVKDTNRNIETIIMPYSIFVNSLIYSNSIEPTKSFYTMRDSDQKSILDQILGIDKFNDYHKVFSDELSHIKNSATMLEKDLEVAESKIESQRNSLYEAVQIQSKVIYDLEERKYELENDVKQKTVQLDINKEKVKELQKTLKQHEESLDRVESNIIELSSRNYQYSIELNNLQQLIDRDISDLTNKLNSDRLEHLNQLESLEFVNRIGELYEELDRLEFEHTKEIDSRKDEYRTRKREIESEHNHLTKTYQYKEETLSDDIRSMSDDLIDKQHQYDECEEELVDLKTQLESDNPTCYVCGQETKSEESKSNLENKLHKLQKVKDEIVITIENLKTDITSKTNDLNRLKKEKEKELDSINLKLSELEEWKTEIKHTIEDKYDAIESTKNKELKDLERKYNIEKEQIEINYKDTLELERLKIKTKWKDKKLELDNLLNGSSKEIYKETRKKKEIKEQIDNIDEDSRNLLSVEIELNHIISKLDQIKDDLKTQDIELKNIDDKYSKRIEMAVTEHDQLKLDLKTKLDDRKMCEFWKKAYSKDGIKAIILDDSIPILNKKSRELSLLTRNLKVSFSAQKQLKSGDNRNQFSILVKQTDNLTDDKKDLSSGESKIVNIIVFLALRNLLEYMHNVKFNIFLLDEVLDALDPDNVGIATDMMRSLSDEYCVVLITHTLRDNIDANELYNLS